MKVLPPRLDRRRTEAARKSASARGGPRIVLAEPDPYLGFLLRLNFPEADVIEADPSADADAILALRPSLVIAGVEGSSLTMSELLAGEAPPKVLAVVDGARAARTTIHSAVDGILARPFVPTDLHRAVRMALGMGDPEAAPGLPGLKLARVRGWIGPARVGAIAIAAVLEVAAPEVSRTRSTILALAFIYVTARWLMRRPSVVWVGADVGVAAVLVAFTDGVVSPYIPFALVVATATGLTHNERWGGIAGLIIAATSTPLIVGDLRDGVVGPTEAVAWYMLAPLAGIAGGFASRLWRTQATQTGDLLAEANSVLSSLYRIARTVPGGLEIGTVADAALEEIRDSLRAASGAMFVWEAGNLALVGSYGFRNPSATSAGASSAMAEMVHGNARVITASDLDDTTAQALGGGNDCWLVAPMRHDGVALGLLLAGCPDHAQHNSNRVLLQQLAQETALAVENARLFSRVREISIDEERRRLARELHDGVAQALTHLRFELEFMARHGAASPATVKQEVERLSRVVNRASGDVRSMIFGLRSSVSAEGLVGSLRAYLSDLRGLGGPDIVFEARGEVRLPPGVEAEIFRVAQEAVSNALRHAGAGTVKVSITSGATAVRLLVEDDGIGVRSKRATGPRGGVGLSAMRERAEAIGATLDVGARPGSGTRVVLEVKHDDRR
ncbi:MAG: GAF domain-containing sensor histidine kinase [Actinomycetota bacterium]